MRHYARIAEVNPKTVFPSKEKINYYLQPLKHPVKEERNETRCK